MSLGLCRCGITSKTKSLAEITIFLLGTAIGACIRIVAIAKRFRFVVRIQERALARLAKHILYLLADRTRGTAFYLVVYEEKHVQVRIVFLGCPKKATCMSTWPLEAMAA